MSRSGNAVKPARRNAFMAVGIGAVAMMLAGCVVDTDAGVVPVADKAPAVSQAQNWPVTPYQCKGGEALDVRFSADGSYATIDQMGERILMKLVPSASGARYQAVSEHYTYTLDTKGEWAALYEAGDKVVLDDCVTAGSLT